MKKLFVLLIITIMFLSCSKDNDLDEDTGNSKTYITITNNLGRRLDNVVVGHMPEGTAFLINAIGNLDAGQKSAPIEVKDKSITQVFLYFDSENKSYMFSYGVLITGGITNNLFITTNWPAHEVNKADPIYPK